VWHQVKNTAVGSELMASSETDEIGASVAQGKNRCSRVRVDGANVVWDCLPKTHMHVEAEEIGASVVPGKKTLQQG